MRIRIIYRGNPPGEPPVSLFGDVLLDSRPRILPQLASLAAHGLVTVALLALAPFVTRVNQDFQRPITYKVEMMRLDMPNRFFPVTQPRSPVAGQAKAPTGNAPPKPSRNSPLIEPAKSLASAANSMELAMTRHSSKEKPIILQPDTAETPDMPIQPLPPMAFWNPAVKKQETPVKPGQAKSQAPPKSDKDPSLTPPHSAAVASNLASRLPDASANPKLPLPNSSSNPIRVAGQSEAPIASFEMPQSDPVALLSFMNDFSIPKTLLVPKAMQNSPQTSATGAAPVSASAGESKGAAPMTQRRTTSTTSPDSDAAHLSPMANRAPSDSAVRPEKAASTTPNSQGSPPSQSVGPAPAVLDSAALKSTASNAARSAIRDSAEAAPAKPPNVIQVKNPANGNFDVVVLQSGSSMQELGGAALTGNPVYTVYLSVGDIREWMLEYCIPGDAVKRSSSFRIQIDDSGPLSAPYPLTTTIPASVRESSRSQNVVLRATLDVAGSFRNVTGPARQEPWLREVISLLEQWKFRPALRDKVPVEVEVLLIIPAVS